MRPAYFAAMATTGLIRPDEAAARAIQRGQHDQPGQREKHDVGGVVDVVPVLQAVAGVRPGGEYQLRDIISGRKEIARQLDQDVIARRTGNDFHNSSSNNAEEDAQPEAPDKACTSFHFGHPTDGDRYQPASDHFIRKRAGDRLPKSVTHAGRGAAGRNRNCVRRAGAEFGQDLTRTASGLALGWTAKRSWASTNESMRRKGVTPPPL